MNILPLIFSIFPELTGRCCASPALPRIKYTGSSSPQIAGSSSPQIAGSSIGGEHHQALNTKIIRNNVINYDIFLNV
jgi:hypothetical protein